MTQQDFISALVSQCRFIVFISICAVASAQQPTATEPRAQSFPTVASHSLRDTVQLLSQRGVSLHSTFVHDLSKSPFNAHGDNSWFARYSFDLSMDLDGPKAMHWNGSSFHLDLKRHAILAGQLYEDVAEGYSNIDADSRICLYEAWVLQTIAQDRLEVQVGLIDANNTFAKLATGADFLNSSMGYDPTIMGFPTYPEPKPGIEASVNLPGSYRISGGGFQTGAGRMALVEADKKWTMKYDGAVGDVEVGYWKLREPVTMRDGEQVSSTHGYYAVVEQSIWSSENSRNGISDRKLTSFLQVGIGAYRENSFRSHLGYGLVFQSPFSRRPADSIGVAATRVRSAGDPDDSVAAKSEFVSEGYYKLALKNSVALLVDTQHFVNPGAGAHSAPFFVLTPRVVFTF
ncbi:MAG TPA: carbohydrate porin [Terracidiphilus sp.]|jgi:carbohydrate-selective porin OprB